MKSPVASACFACSSVRNLVRVIISVFTCSNCTLLVLFDAMANAREETVSLDKRLRGIGRMRGVDCPLSLTSGLHG